jgi:hypothetical protein
MCYLKSLLFGLIVLPFLANAAETIPDDKAVLQFQAKIGLVTFNHFLHATLRTNECESCHHTHEPGAPFQPCSDCHKKKKKTPVVGFSVVAPKSSKAYHLKCKGCHEYTIKELEKPAGPTKCKLCHVKATDG